MFYILPEFGVDRSFPNSENDGAKLPPPLKNGAQFSHWRALVSKWSSTSKTKTSTCMYSVNHGSSPNLVLFGPQLRELSRTKSSLPPNYSREDELNLPACAVAPRQKCIGCDVRGTWNLDPSDILPTPPYRGGGENVRKFTKWSISQPRSVRFRSNLVQSMITWHPMYNKRWRSRGQRSRSQRDITTAKIILLNHQ